MSIFKKEASKGFPWKRSRDEVQIQCWSHFCEDFAEVAGMQQWRDQLAQTYLGCEDQVFLNVAFDYGQSTKMIAEYLPQSSKVIGLNNSAVLTARAIERVANPKASFLFDSLKKLDFKSDYFNKIIVERVLYQVEDIDAKLKEFVRVLKPGAEIVLCEPDFSKWHTNVGEEVSKALSYQFLQSMLHADIGANLIPLARQYGLEVGSEQVFDVVWTDFESLDYYLNLEGLLNLAGFDRDQVKAICKEFKSLSSKKELKMTVPMMVLSCKKQ